jgi:hypothetical protein
MKVLVLFISLVLAAGSLYPQIDNPDKPIKGQWDLKMKKLWETKSAGPHVFAEIQNIEAADDGRVYVLDAKNFQVYIFGKEGKYLSAFGKKGEGPGEFRTVHMGQQLYVIQDRLIFLERGRLHFFSLEGQYQKTAVYPAQYRPRVFVSPHLFISAPVTVDDPRQRETPITLYNLKTGQSKEIARFRPFDRATATESGEGRQVTVAIVIGEITPLMELAYRDNKIYYGMTNQYRVHIADIDGKTVGQFGIPDRQPVKVSKEFLNELKEQLKDVPGEFLKRILDGLPPNASYFFDISVGAGGEIYTFISDPDSKSGKRIDVFSPQGRYLYGTGFQIPKDHTLSTSRLKDDRLFTASEDEEGNIILTAYRLYLPPSD